MEKATNTGLPRLLYGFKNMVRRLILSQTPRVPTKCTASAVCRRNNGVGLVFDYMSSESLKILVWEDPTGSYEWYDPPSQLTLYELLDGDWTTVATASSDLDLSVDEDEWATLKVQVDSGFVSGFFNGTEVLSGETTVVEGPGRVGVWTWDNDGGVCFGDVLVSLL